MVATHPDDVAARLKLIALLLEAGRSVEAMVHAETIMSAHPDSPEAYRAAAACAQVAHDRRAGAFTRVADALENYHEEALPDVWSGFTPPEAAEVSTAGEQPPASPPAAADHVAPEAPHETGVVEDSDSQTPTSKDPSPQTLVINPETIEHPQLSFKNIIGVAAVKRRIADVVLTPLNEHPDRQIGGVLMFGPPGCGKSFFARTIAGELDAGFLSIEMGTSLDWPGDPRDNIHRLFNAARAAAPCVMFLNDIELVGVRAAGEDAPDRRLLTRLAAELANTAANRGITMIAGSTAPWHIDISLLTSGAIDRTLLVVPPDTEAREAILRFQFQSVPLAGLDVNWIVERTQHFSGNDLLLLCERAQELATDDGLNATPTVAPGHMTRALREIRPSAPKWFSVAVEHAVGANRSGMYDDTLAYIDEHHLA
jgi:SpoVK/Ycf46/Vps4 family AAA+-type ATPase